MPERELDTITQRFRASKQSLTERHDDWVSRWKLYKSTVDDGTPENSELFIPVCHWVVESMVPRLISGLIGSKPMVSAIPNNPAAAQSSKVIETLMDHYFRKLSLGKKLTASLRDSLVFDAGIMKDGWKTKEETRGNEDIEVYDGPSLEYVDPFSFFPDPYARSIDDAKYVIQRYFIDKDRAIEMQEDNIIGPGVGGESIENVSTTSHRKDGDDDPKTNRVKSLAETHSKVDSTREWVEVLEYWEDDYVQFVANENTMIRSTQNPYDHMEKPFHVFVDYPSGDQIYGQGEVENIEDLQHEINTKRNQRIDSVNMQIAPPVIKSPSALIDDEEMVLEPYAVWTAFPDDIQFAQLPDVTPPSVREEQLCVQNIMEVTGVSSIQLGQPGPDTPNTATGVSTLDSNAATKFQQKLRSYEETMKRMANHVHKLISQYKTRSDAIRITEGIDDLPEERVTEEGGYRFLNYSPEDIAKDFDFKVNAAKSETQQQRQQRMLQVLQSIAPIASEVNIKEVFKELFDTLGFEDVERFINIPSEQQQRLEQQRGEQTQGRGPAPSEQQENGNVPQGIPEELQQLIGQAEGGQ